MCGIVALVSRPSTRAVPTPDEILALIDGAVRADDISAMADRLQRANSLLKGVPGVRALLDHRELALGITARLDRVDAVVAEEDSVLESGVVSGDELESRATALIALRDATWAIRNDRLRTANAVLELSGRDANPGSIAAYLMLQQSFSVLDRIEVRGRDSAGIHVYVWNHGLDRTDATIASLVAERSGDVLFQNRAVRWIDGESPVLSFVYKAAFEIGELGDNTRALRQAIVDDELLRRALADPAVRVSLVAHTRWASVGIISEPNAHPVNNEMSGVSDGPYVVAALNGDVDNHADLRIEHGLRFANQITTDAKVIPAMVNRFAATGLDTVEAFR